MRNEGLKRSIYAEEVLRNIKANEFFALAMSSNDAIGLEFENLLCEREIFQLLSLQSFYEPSCADNLILREKNR